MVSCPVLLQFYKELLCNDYDSFSSVTITIHVVSGSVLDSLVAVKYKYKYNSKKKKYHQSILIVSKAGFF